MNKTVLIVIAAIIVLAVAGFLVLNPNLLNNQSQDTSMQSGLNQGANMPEGETHEMILGENGYEPENITIKQGDIILFSTSGDQPFWPASDIHPTHGIFPEFDPMEPVPADSAWAFQFNKVGAWSYHDHLYPYFTGTITVEE